MGGAGINSDHLLTYNAEGENDKGKARKEMRHLRSVIADLEPRLRDSIKDAQLAGPGRSCSPRHRIPIECSSPRHKVPIESMNDDEGSMCVG